MLWIWGFASSHSMVTLVFTLIISSRGTCCKARNCWCLQVAFPQWINFHGNHRQNANNLPSSCFSDAPSDPEDSLPSHEFPHQTWLGTFFSFHSSQICKRINTWITLPKRMEHLPVIHRTHEFGKVTEKFSVSLAWLHGANEIVPLNQYRSRVETRDHFTT